jgi:hypothetical protein
MLALNPAVARRPAAHRSAHFGAGLDGGPATAPAAGIPRRSVVVS